MRATSFTENGLLIEEYEGACPRTLPERFFNEASLAARSSILWDIAPEKRRELFISAMSAARVSAFAYDGQKRPLAACWLAPLSGGSSLAATLHFFPCHAGRRAWHAAGRAFLFNAESFAAKFQSILCLVPDIFRPTLELLSRLGFECLAALPGACHFAGCQMTVDGLLFMLKRPAFTERAMFRAECARQKEVFKKCEAAHEKPESRKPA